jgi:nucleotide-binding universal stress UspA family protein
MPRYKTNWDRDMRSTIEHRENAMKFDRVLVPLDGSPLAEMALPKATALLSDSPSATLILLRAVEAPTLPWVDPTEAQFAVVREAEEYLEAVATRLRNEGLPRVATSVWYSSAARAIVEAAGVRRVNLIVMSTHGRSGLCRVVRGSVAESVLRGTPTPILLVSAAGARVETPRRTTAGRSEGTRHSYVAARGIRPSSWQFGEAVGRRSVLSRRQR